MFRLSAKNPFSAVPDEDLCRIFQYLKVQGLISCSFVCKRFYDCSNDTSVWRWVVCKNPSEHYLSQEDLSKLGLKQLILDHFSGPDIKRIILDLFRNRVRPRNAEFFVFEQSPPNLESWQKSPAATLPLEFKGNRYLIHEGGEKTDMGDDYYICEEWSELEIKNAESNETQKRIRLKGVVDTNNAVATDGEIFIYSHSNEIWGEKSTKTKLVWLTGTGSEEKTLTREPPEDYSVEIKKGVVCLANSREAINFNYAIIPLTELLSTLKKMEKGSFDNPSNQIAVLSQHVSFTEKVPKEFICLKTNRIMWEPVQLGDGEWIEKEALSKGKLQATIDKKLQVKILAWLNREAFEKPFDQLSQEEKALIDWHINKENTSKGATAIPAADQLYLHLYCRWHNVAIPPRLLMGCGYYKPELMQAFVKLPSVFQQEIYSHLCVIQGRQVSAELGEDAFHDRNGQSSTIAEKLDAVRRCVHEVELDALGYF